MRQMDGAWLGLATGIGRAGLPKRKICVVEQSDKVQQSCEDSEGRRLHAAAWREFGKIATRLRDERGGFVGWLRFWEEDRDVGGCRWQTVINGGGCLRGLPC